VRVDAEGAALPRQLEAAGDAAVDRAVEVIEVERQLALVGRPGDVAAIVDGAHRRRIDEADLGQGGAAAAGEQDAQYEAGSGHDAEWVAHHRRSTRESRSNTGSNATSTKRPPSIDDAIMARIRNERLEWPSSAMP
jgi:hypothetical protein